MKVEIIYTDDYALIVSNEEMKKGDFNVPSDFDRTSDISITSEEDLEVVNDRFNGYKKIIAHRPLIDAPILKDVPLLPEFGKEDDVKKISLEMGKEFYIGGNYDFENGVRKGYNKAKETYKYTEADIQKAFIAGEERIINKPNSSELDDFTNFIQSLQQPKRPKYFKCETTHDCCGRYMNCKGCDATADMLNIRMKTTNNSQGQTELVGEYSYE